MNTRRVSNCQRFYYIWCILILTDSSMQVLIKHPPKGLAIKQVRNMFFPYWKSVLSCGPMVKIVPACQPSRKDLLSAEASKKGIKKSTGNLGSVVRPQSASNYESRRMLCAVASMSRKVLFKRTWEILRRLNRWSRWVADVGGGGGGAVHAAVENWELHRRRWRGIYLRRVVTIS